MNIEYLVVKETPRLDSGVAVNKEAHSASSQQRDFNSSYQAVRKEQADRVRSAQSDATRQRKDKASEAQANANSRQQEKVAEQSAAAKARRSPNSSDKKEVNAKQNEANNNGKPLPSSEKSGKPDVAKSEVTKSSGRQKEAAPETELQTVVDETEIQANQDLDQISLISSEESVDLDVSVLSTGELKVDTVLESDEGVHAGVAETVKTDELSTIGHSEALKKEGGERVADDELELKSAEVDGLPEEAAQVIDTDLDKTEQASLKEEEVPLTGAGVTTASSVAATLEKRENLNSEKEVPVEKVVVLASPGVGRTEKLTTEKLTTEKLTQTEQKNSGTKTIASVSAITQGGSKAPLDAGAGESVPREALEEQLALLKTENGKGEIKSSANENLSVSDLALKEAKSGTGTKALDFAKTLVAEKQPLRETIELPVSHKKWGESLAEKTALLVGKKGNFARLNLVPHNLGPLEIRVQLQGDTSNVEFVALNPATKDAIEQAIPRLKEMFEAGGIDLGDVNVSSQSQKEKESEQMRKTAEHQSVGDADESADESEQELSSGPRLSLLNGRVDFYA
ncbi:MAG: flagellar hook-length control protein FliK [Gammaproteobacteria bacterium]|nr:flagellar hook-length control protein FliK [Gammaproteobacteria bacterium]